MAGGAEMDTVPSAPSTAMAQTLAGVLGAKQVRGLPALGPHGGVEATAPTAPGLVGPLGLGAQTHLGLHGRAARLPPLPVLPSPRLFRVSPPHLFPTVSR
jgi:hypothetical protein